MSNRTDLKLKWHRGYRPVEADYSELFDFTYLKSDDDDNILSLVVTSGQVVNTQSANQINGYPRLESVQNPDNPSEFIPLIKDILIPFVINKNLTVNGLHVLFDFATDGVITTAGLNAPLIDSSYITNSNKITTDSFVSSSVISNTISASTYQGVFTGNAWTASRLETPRTIAITGDGTYITTFSGSANSTGALTLANVFTAGQGSYQYNSFVVNSKGLITTAISAEYLIPSSPSLNLQTVTSNGASASSAILLTNTTDSNSTSEGALIISGGVAVGKNLFVKGTFGQTLDDGKRLVCRSVGQASVSATALTVIDSTPVSARSAKYTIQITQGTKYQVSEILVLHDDTIAHTSEYAILETNGVLGSFSADIVGSNIVFYVTMATDVASIINFKKTTIVKSPTPF
jgi:hypothetical protein